MAWEDGLKEKLPIRVDDLLIRLGLPLELSEVTPMNGKRNVSLAQLLADGDK